MTSKKSFFLFALLLSSATYRHVSGRIFLSRIKKLTSGGELVRADRAELFPRDNITCAHNTKINVVVYFTFHHRGRETRCRPGALAAGTTFASFRRVHGRRPFRDELGLDGVISPDR